MKLLVLLTAKKIDNYQTRALIRKVSPETIAVARKSNPFFRILGTRCSSCNWLNQCNAVSAMISVSPRFFSTRGLFSSRVPLKQTHKGTPSEATHLQYGATPHRPNLLKAVTDCDSTAVQSFHEQTVRMANSDLLRPFQKRVVNL